MIHFASAVRRCSESRTASGAAYIPSTFRADYTTPTTIVRNRASMGLWHVAPMGLWHVAPMGLSHRAPMGLIAQGGAPGSCISPLQGDATMERRPGLMHFAPTGRRDDGATTRGHAFRPYRATRRWSDDPGSHIAPRWGYSPRAEPRAHAFRPYRATRRWSDDPGSHIAPRWGYYFLLHLVLQYLKL